MLTARALGVRLRSILVEREPIYRQQAPVASFCPQAFGLDEQLAADLSDDHVGRALDRLFDVDRGTLLTQIIVAATQQFEVSLDELHDDSTSVRLCGHYTMATGRSMREKRAPWITYGYSKDHRPDLKQLLFVLTTRAAECRGAHRRSGRCTHWLRREGRAWAQNTKRTSGCRPRARKIALRCSSSRTITSNASER